MSATRRDLIDAQRDIFRNQDIDEAAGAREETEGHERTHRRYYELEKQVPPKERRGVWDQALNEHQMEKGELGHLHLAWGQPKRNSLWWRHEDEEQAR